MKASKVTVTITLFFLVMALGVLPQQVNIPMVKASTLPADTDAWTENDNATYPWIHNPTHFGEETFSTDFAQVGSYSLKANHTSTTTSYYFALDLGAETDVSSYWALSAYIRCENKSGYRTIYVAMSSTSFPSVNSGIMFSYGLRIENGTTNRAVMPLALFSIGKSPSWTTIRYIIFYVTGLSSQDYATFYVDSLHFMDESTDPATTNSLDDTALANLYSAFLSAEFLQVYSGTSYTGLSDWMTTTTGAQADGNLDIENLGQSIFILSYLYDLTGWIFYRDKAEVYGTWLLTFQNQSYGYYHSNYNNVTEAYATGTSPAVGGWALAGMSYLYGITSDSTYKDSADLARGWFCDYMWNGTDASDAGWFNFWNATSGAGYGTTFVAGMAGGGTYAGLGTYYNKVEQNTTVRNQFNFAFQRQYNLYYGRTSGGVSGKHILYFGTTEEIAYSSWGFYMMSQQNSTYWDIFVKYSAQNLMSAFYQYDNIGLQAQVGFFHTTKGESYKHHTWAMSVGLELAYLASQLYDTSSKAFIEEALKDSLAILKGDYWLIPFDDHTYATTSWTPTALFFYTAMLDYYLDNVNDPFAVSSTGDVTASSFAGETLTLTVDGTGTTTTRVYCGGKGAPLLVTGGEMTDYDNQIATIEVQHNSEEDVEVSWAIKASGHYNLVVYVKKDGVSYPNALVIVEGEEKGTDLLGQASFELSTGTYFVTATIGEETKNKTVTVHDSTSIGFEFLTIQANRAPSIILEVGIIVVVGVVLYLFVYPMFLRRGKK